MKYILSILLFILFISCKDKSATTAKATDSNPISVEADPNWLLGDWQRTNDKEGVSTYEYWDKNKYGQFVSMGVRLKGLDTTWKETVLLHKVEGIWKFEVSMQNDSLPTIFEVTKMDNKSFVCENPLNEFPKQISYAFDGEKLNAEISGGGPTIPYHFEKMK